MNEELLIRFLTHTCSIEELKQVDKWIVSDKANADWLFEMERVWSLKDELRFSDKQEIEKAFRQFIGKIDKKKHKHISFYQIFKYAAIIVIVSLLSLNLYKMDFLRESEFVNEIYVPKGERANVTLSDGSHVVLNSDTKFTYPSRFSKDNRNVELLGEGYFEVTHNSKKPFFVNSRLIHVKVLGTKFNMKAYPNESSIVTLKEGKVEVESTNKKDKLTLHPNEEVSYSEVMGMKLVNVLDTNISNSWTKGEIVYVDKTLNEICQGLEHKYNVDIIIVDKDLSEDVFTCHFTGTASISEIMKLLKETRRLDYSFNKNKIWIVKYKKH